MSGPQAGEDRQEATGIREVLVGLGHGSGGPELVWAASLAAHTSSRLTICHVCSSGTGCQIARPGPSCAHPPETSVLTLLGGDPATELAKLSHRASHLVVGASGYHGPSSLLYPATAIRVIEHSDSSVTVVCPHLGSGQGPLAGHVVVGVDSSDGNRQALAYAAEYAADHQVPLAVVHVLDRYPGQQWSDDQPPAATADQPDQAWRLLTEALDQLPTGDGEARPRRVLAGGVPARELLRVSGGARLLVLGSRRTGDRDPGFGSVTRTVVSHAGCPVAVVHHHRRSR